MAGRWDTKGRAAIFALLLGMAAPLAQGMATTMPDCGTKPDDTKATSGVIYIEPGKDWQPRGGQIEFTIKAANQLGDATILVCFGWQNGQQHPEDYTQSAPARILGMDADRSLRLAVTIPNLPPAPPRDFQAEDPTKRAGRYTGFWIVPLANMRVLAFDATGKILLDSQVPVGITSAILSAAVAIGVVVVALLLLSIIKLPSLAPPATLPLRLVSDANGYASLSQFQIILWSFVVGASAAYVMALSGTLIEITSGALVLLGISSAAVLGARIKASQDARAAGLLPTAAIPQRRPQWSDLVRGDDGQIDVTRLQMAFFTLIAAAFVTLKVGVSYTIPTIPENFLLLMGISNGVYLAGKYTKPPVDSGASTGKAAAVAAPAAGAATGLVGDPPVPAAVPVPPPPKQ
jgi:hypothetical protein